MATYAVIEVATGMVINMVGWDGISEYPPPEGCIFIQTDVAWMDWTYADGVFTPPPPPPPDLVALAFAARAQRDYLLSYIYDRGISIAMRELRLTADSTRIAYINGKVAELDAYAVALMEVPETEGFPLTINWPVEPTA